MSNLAETIAQAQEAAGEIIDHVPAVQETQTAAVMTFQKPTMKSAMATRGIGSSVNTWLKVNQYGLQVGPNRKIIDSLKVKVYMTEGEGFFVKHSIKYGNPIQYASSYDGVSCDKGGLFSEVVARAMAISPKAKVFNTTDLIFTLMEDLVIDKNTKIEAGTKVGHTLSTTNWRNWEDFYSEVAKGGLLDTEVEVTLTSEEVNHGGYTWGVLCFDL